MLAYANTIQVQAAGRVARVRCSDAGLRATLDAVYAPMRRRADHADIEYAVEARGTGFVVRGPAGAFATAAGPGGVLPLIDEQLAVGFQWLRPELLFLHAAALASRERAFLLVAPSGGGKSTTAWALTHHGFGYLSDELAPVELAGLAVHPYRRALALKDRPPAPYGLPSGAVLVGRSAWVPIDTVPSQVRFHPLRLAALFFLDRHTAGAARTRRLTASEAAVRLYANALNALAHPADGLDAVVDVVSRVPAFELTTSHLANTHLAVREVLESLA
jgi:hypothetical protein